MSSSDRSAPRVATDFRKETAYCTYCPKLCRHSCPVADAEKRETVTPQAKMQVLHHVNRREMALTREVADVFYRCTGCRRQKTYCLHGNEVDEAMFAGRVLAVERGVEPAALEGFETRFGRRRRELAARLRKEVAREHLLVRQEGRAAEPVDILVYPGCVQLSENPGGVLETLALVRRLGLGRAAVFAGDDPCTGFPFATTGRPGALARHAERQARLLTEARIIVASCPGCVHTLRVTYAEHGVRIDAEVLHLSELLARHADRLSLEPTGRPIAYHDPCYLGRHLGVYEPPRKLVGAVGTLVEMAHCRDDSLCSGGGGALPLTAPATADAIASTCLKVGLDGQPGCGSGCGTTLPAAQDGERPILATGCPQAARMLRRAAERNGSPVEVRELGALLFRSLAGNEPEPAT